MAPVPVVPLVDQSAFHDRAVIDGSLDLQTLTTVDGIYRFASLASRTLFGWEPQELIGRRQDSFVHPDDAVLVRSARSEALLGTGRATMWRFLCADGTYRWTEALSTSVDVQGERLILATIRDVGDRTESELELERRATTDPLTGIANRTVFMDRLHQALRRLARRGGFVAVLYLDLDRFKSINDSVGHHMGDAVLLQMAERLSHFVRPQDTLARLGGDEFAIAVEDLDWAEDAVALSSRLIEAGRAPFVVGDERFVCTISIGVSATSDSQDSAEALLRQADLALYRAKDRGRDRAEVFDEDLHARAVGRLGTERMLRRAMDESRLRVEYQPVVDLRSGETLAAEALVRVWDPAQDRLVVAEAFIKVAEAAGLVGRMDEWMLARTMEQAAEWRDLFAGTRFTGIASNVAGRELADPRFAPSVVEVLEARDLPGGALQIEVTERVLMEASNSALSGLKLLRAAGVKLILDDFGTDCSSLSTLRLFPLDFVKIDGSLVRVLQAGGPERAIVASIIDLCHALDIAVVAEGVETPAQLDDLVALGCDRAQGFWLARPGPPRSIEDRVLHHLPGGT